MNITVHLHTILQIETPDGTIGQVEATIPPGSTLADVLDYLEIEMQPEALLLVVNGRMAGLEQQLREGDRVNLMPAISGG
ncbi:MAG TPA: MoaD/ThiS family protein [Anaerolineales bacterium]